MCELRTAGQRQKDKARRESEGARLRRGQGWGGGGIVCFLTHQGHPELECDWKSPVCLCCLPHKIIQTGCSADNVTVLTTPPFSFCFKLCEMAGMWECHSHTYTCRQAEAGTHTHTHPLSLTLQQQPPSDVRF